MRSGTAWLFVGVVSKTSTSGSELLVGSRLRSKSFSYRLRNSGDPKLAHAILKCGSLHPETCGGAVGSGQYPVGFFQHGENVLALGFRQGIGPAGATASVRCRLL